MTFQTGQTNWDGGSTKFHLFTIPFDCSYSLILSFTRKLKDTKIYTNLWIPFKSEYTYTISPLQIETTNQKQKLWYFSKLYSSFLAILFIGISNILISDPCIKNKQGIELRSSILVNLFSNQNKTPPRKKNIKNQKSKFQGAHS